MEYYTNFLPTITFIFRTHNLTKFSLILDEIKVTYEIQSMSQYKHTGFQSAVIVL